MSEASTRTTKTVSMPGGWPKIIIIFDEDDEPTQFQLSKLEGPQGESKETTFILEADVALELFNKALEAL